MTVFYSLMKTDFADLHLFANEEGLLGVYVGAGLEGAKKRFRATEIVEIENAILKTTKSQLQEYLQGQRTEFDIPLNIQGTEFEKMAWSALQKIPYGKTWSYNTQAQKAGRPTAVRAIASANGRNPFSIVIPCHRVIRSTGHLGGYSGGLDVKVQLLKIEGTLDSIKSE